MHECDNPALRRTRILLACVRRSAEMTICYGDLLKHLSWVELWALPQDTPGRAGFGYGVHHRKIEELRRPAQSQPV